jgi:regulation of enolase protein 1 (concanavalin A-like superfamily)
LKDFVSATVSLSFVCTERYDQGGLLFSLRQRDSSGKASSTSEAPEKWIKTGIEFYKGKPMLSTVTCDSWADWSVAPLDLSLCGESSAPKGIKVDWTTISIVKETDQHGVSLWVYQIDQTGEKRSLREVTWVYGLDAEQWDLEILAMAARPEVNSSEKLEVTFRDIEIHWEH